MRRRVRPTRAQQPARTAGPCRARDACASASRTRQHNTHSTESRSVVYPWHPWYGRSTTVYEVLTRGGHAVCRCGLDEERSRRSLEIPAWMLEPAACRALRLMVVPTVDCDALLEVQAVLRTARGFDTTDRGNARHPSVDDTGGANATVREARAICATQSLSEAACASVISEAPAGDAREDDRVAGPVAAARGRSEDASRPGPGGGR